MTSRDVVIRSKKQQALALLQGSRPVEAGRILQEVCALDRNDVESWMLLVQIHALLGNPDQVEKCCREIIRINPSSPDAHYHLGCALMLQGRQKDASAVFQRVLQLKPDHGLGHLQSGHLSTNVGDALRHYQRAVQLAPALAEAHGAFGAALVSSGRVDDAISSFRECLRLKPGLHGLHSGLLFALCYSATHDVRAVFAEHVRWGQEHALPSAWHHANTREPDRRLRVGYVSPDMREHSVAYFFEPLLASHSADEVETFCYAEVSIPDSTTRRLQSLCAHWFSSCGTSDRDLVERIRGDKIDILVDLAGHSSNNRLLAFSARPAPVQVTYLGYPNTTGMTSIDYRITDAWADPQGINDGYCTESLVRLPHGFLCYLPPTDTPPVTPLPALSRGFITYGSFNNLPKITVEVVSLWASILHATPNARLVLKNFSLSDPATSERYLQLFAERGIARDRLDFRGRNNSMWEHLGSYGEIDITLDTFPYNGTTTTCESLLMGVPVVSLAGRMHASRVGVTLLSQAGLSGLIAETPDDYVRRAIDLSKNPESLSRLRVSLREQIKGSVLCDGKSFAQDMEAAYRTMWRKWCDGEKNDRLT